MLANTVVRLRAVEPEDLEFLYHCENDARYWQVSNTLTPYSRYVLKQYIANAQADIYTQKQLRLIIESVIEPVQQVGAIDLFDFDPYNARAGVGILICSDQHLHKGLATNALNLLVSYCFKHLALHQLYCNIGANNQASIRLFEHAGFVKCGEKVNWNKTPNGWCNELMYQLINNQS